MPTRHFVFLFEICGGTTPGRHPTELMLQYVCVVVVIIILGPIRGQGVSGPLCMEKICTILNKKRITPLYENTCIMYHAYCSKYVLKCAKCTHPSPKFNHGQNC